MIKFQNITQKYEHNIILNNINLTIYDGEIFVIVGSSGSGKTTLLRMLNKLTIPTSGQIFYNGQNLSIYPILKLRQKIGCVFQDPSLFPNLTVAENIGIGLIHSNLSKQDQVLRQDQLLTEVDLNPKKYRDRMPDELSGGQQQRIGIIRALANNPQVVLMDEPFSAVDPIVRKQLQYLIIELHKKNKQTVIFVTHDMDEAVRLGDRIAVLHNGNIEQIGTPQELINHPQTNFVNELFARNTIEQVLDLEYLLNTSLAEKVAFTTNYPIYEINNTKDLIAQCNISFDEKFIIKTKSGQYLIDPKKIWQVLLNEVNYND